MVNAIDKIFIEACEMLPNNTKPEAFDVLDVGNSFLNAAKLGELRVARFRVKRAKFYAMRNDLGKGELGEVFVQEATKFGNEVNECLMSSKQDYAVAAKFYEKAAKMDKLGIFDFAPADAMWSLLKLHRDGILDGINSKFIESYNLNTEKKFDSAVLQIALAEMFFEGKGAPKSVKEALYWTRRAWDNRDQISPSRTYNLQNFIRKVESEYNMATKSLHPSSQVKTKRWVGTFTPSCSRN